MPSFYVVLRHKLITASIKIFRLCSACSYFRWQEFLGFQEFLSGKAFKNYFRRKAC